MASSDKIKDVLLGKFSGATTLRKFFDAVGDTLDETVDAITALKDQRHLDVAAGVWLDRIGGLLGLARGAYWVEECFEFEGVEIAINLRSYYLLSKFELVLPAGNEVIVDWGDDSTTTITGTGDDSIAPASGGTGTLQTIQHTYASPTDTYRAVTLTGDVDAIRTFYNYRAYCSNPSRNNGSTYYNLSITAQEMAKMSGVLDIDLSNMTEVDFVLADLGDTVLGQLMFVVFAFTEPPA